MCGRYAATAGVDELVEEFEIVEVGDGLPGPSWNVAPTDPVPLVVERLVAGASATRRRLVAARWGLVPSWAKDTRGAARLINARMETVTEKPSFRKAAAQRRGLLPAEGYYEWQKLPGGRKLPTFLHGDSDRTLAFAALFENWPDPALPEDHPAKWLRTVTIITTAASDALGHIHDRTPLIVPSDLQRDWLDPATTSEADVRGLLASIPPPRLVPRVVSDRVNAVRNNGPDLIEAVRDEPS
ncbi:SOS response-associated peptidase [Raineyella fluvialis]|uniref:Abasic site processing protein n=1 Tax=Raineyella fluvialis TaxID=2662261 RepID=A0A5Q2FJE9_9ACTN|nr:SOS response-associated peptidase [Raineyella fluvialis]QGF24436.1 SOS response-associated peptidase [Raineyella fluvialis]